MDFEDYDKTTREKLVCKLNMALEGGRLFDQFATAYGKRFKSKISACVHKFISFNITRDHDPRTLTLYCGSSTSRRWLTAFCRTKRCANRLLPLLGSPTKPSK
eukprot:3081327-Pleurochrysis_carterae.AAC.1